HGDWGGTATLDNCGTCVGGNTGAVACVQDCHGDWGGTATLDNCGTCVGGNTGAVACVQDCHGDWGGTAYVDNCSTCVGGNTGLTPCAADCHGDFGGTAYLDNCGTCVGGNTGAVACVQDCHGDWGGTATLDNCGTCVGGNTGAVACVQDCHGDWGGTALPGTACDDGDAGTENDMYDGNCECHGTVIVTYDCPVLQANIGDACNDGDMSTVNDVIDANCECHGTPVGPVCQGNQVVVRILADANPSEITWEVLDAGGVVIATGSPAMANAMNEETVCLSATVSSTWYGFRLHDSFGDGISSGNWELRSVDGKLILRDDFGSGSISPEYPGPSPAYGDAHSFGLPLGQANIAPGNCGVFNNMLGAKVFANKVGGNNYLGQTLNYQFEFSNPDAGFIRRIARPYNYVHFWDMVTKPLTPGVKYFARVRTDKNGPMQEAFWGAGCEMGISTAVVGCSGLIPAPAYGHSCNEVRSFNTNNSFIYATPVVGGTEYQFRIYNSDESYNQVFSRSTYILQLKWNSNVAPPLINGNTYNVEISVKVNDVWSGFCGNVCTITIDNNQGQGNRLVEMAMGEATMWPNPVRGGQVNLNIEGMQAPEQHIVVDIKDVYGQHVYGQEFSNNGQRFQTILELPGRLATGVYMVNITVNGETTVKRLSIVR
ncbi:MAG TPA: T9SS type A sorting domain-containing protein, partial [Flavobacteriales bacterium]|nr:T9SS type A sorting domain-containing protein [Flavobacteriales bacterium]